MKIMDSKFMDCNCYSLGLSWMVPCVYGGGSAIDAWSTAIQNIENLGLLHGYNRKKSANMV